LAPQDTLNIAQNTRICKECDESVPYIRSGQMLSKGNQKRYVYRDAKGGRWRGLTCASCTTHKMSDTTFVMEGRNCRQCGCRTANYFKCKDCQPKNQLGYYIEAMGGTAY
jgi:hypothetical protein